MYNALVLGDLFHHFSNGLGGHSYLLSFSMFLIIYTSKIAASESSGHTQEALVSLCKSFSPYNFVTQAYTLQAGILAIDT